MKKNVITAKVQRFNPTLDHSPSYRLYEIESEESMLVLSLINKIHDNIDRSLAYRNVGCNLGVCAACLMNINGKNLRACSTIVQPGDNVTIEPAQKYPVVRDLVVDFGASRERTESETVEKK